jgi:hypothetical protein
MWQKYREIRLTLEIETGMIEMIIVVVDILVAMGLTEVITQIMEVMDIETIKCPIGRVGIKYLLVGTIIGETLVVVAVTAGMMMTEIVIHLNHGGEIISLVMKYVILQG